MMKKMRRGRGISVVLCWAMLLGLGVPLLPFSAAPVAAAGSLQEDFESYGDSQSGYTSPFGSAPTEAQPWHSEATGTTNWSVSEETGAAGTNHYLQQTDATVGAAYVITNEYWGISESAISDSDIVLTGKLKVTGANSTYAGLVARHSVDNGTAAYYRFTMKKNTSTYQFYLDKVTGNSRVLVPQTAGTPNASGVSVANTVLQPYLDANQYLPLTLEVIENLDASVTLEGYYGDQLVLSGTDTTPYTAGQVGVFSQSGTTAFDDFGVSLSGSPPSSSVIPVSNSSELNAAIQAAAAGDTILLEDGDYSLSTINGIHGTAEAPIVIRAENKGQARFTNAILLKLSSYITIQDMEFSLDLHNSNWVRLTGNHHIRITNNHFHSPGSVTSAQKSTWILIDGANSHDNRVDHNLMEDKKDLGEMIVVVGLPLPSPEMSQQDVIEYNIIRHSIPRQTDNGMEVIRVGMSHLTKLNSYTLIQYNLFEHCDAEPEIVSIKTGSNTVRYNYFIESLGSLSLRAGNGSSVYGNLFIGNKVAWDDPDPDIAPVGTGGIRINGENHKIYNNYFQGLTGSMWDAAFTIMNGDAEDNRNGGDIQGEHYKPEHILIANNTIVGSDAGFEIGYTNNGKFTLAPEDITIANNIAVTDKQEAIKLMTPVDGLTLSGNIMYTRSGIPLVTGNSTSVTSSEVLAAFPMMKDEVLYLDQEDYAWLWASNSSENVRLRTITYKKISANSPAIDAAIGNYGSGGDYSIVADDMEGDSRDGSPDVGADEFNASTVVDAASPSWSGTEPLSHQAEPRQVQLVWAPATDDTGIAAYRIYKDNALYDIVFGDEWSYTVSSLTPGTNYTFRIEAVDEANRTAVSNTLNVSTPDYSGISLTGIPGEIALSGADKQLVTIAHFEDNSTEVVTSGVTFSSSHTGAITVSAEGRVSAEGLGSSTLSATYMGMAATPLVLTVKPSTQVTMVVDSDTYVDSITSTLSNTNFNNAAELPIKTSNGRRTGYIQTTFPQLADVIDSVQLRLYVGKSDNGSILQIMGLLDDSWDPNIITANNQPASSVSDVWIDNRSNIDDDSYVLIDVTAFYNSQSDAELSFRLTGTVSGRANHVKTRESGDSNQAPTLIFTTIDPD